MLFFIAAALITAICPNAYAGDQTKVLKKKIERKRFEDVTKELESQDKLGNFEIQGLMSA